MTLPVEVVAGRERPDVSYSPSRVTLFGVPMYMLAANIGSATQTLSTPATVNVWVQPCSSQDGKVQFYSALIYAYAYQGHCYNLPEPTLVLVQGPQVPAVGFGFDTGTTPYCMWQVEKLDRTMQLEMTSDTFEEIILKRGLTGTKQPMSYASRASISHRGGKLSE